MAFEFDPTTARPEGEAAPQFDPDTATPAKEATLGERVSFGARRMVNSARTTLTDDPNKIAQIASEQAKAAPAQSAAARQMQEEIKPYADAANNATGVVDTVKTWGALGAKRAGQLISNPGETVKMIAEQLPNSVPGLAGAVAGAKAGAMAGTAVAPGVGTAIGAVGGGVLGGLAGGYLTEKGAAIQEQVQTKAAERGIDLQDQQAVAGVYRSNQAEIDKAATLKAVGTAGTDAVLNVLTAGLSGMGRRILGNEVATMAEAVKAGRVSTAEAVKQLGALEARAVAQSALPATLARGAAVTGAEMLGEGVSEAVGQKLAYGKVDAGDVVDESLLGLGQGVAMAGASSAVNRVAGTPDRDQIQQNIASLRERLLAGQDAAPAQGAAADPLMLPNTQPDRLYVFPDGTVGRTGEVESYLANLPEDERVEARARLLGQNYTEVNDPQAQQARRWWENYGQGQDRQPSPDYVAEVQAAVRSGTPFTTQQTVETVRSAMEDAWLAQNVSTEAPGAAETADAVGEQLQGEFEQAGGDAAVAAVDARVRTSRVLGGLQNILDAGAENSLQALSRLNTSLTRIGEQPLTGEEASRVRRIVDAYMGFRGVGEPAPLPTLAPPAVDPFADNTVMESLIPERPSQAMGLDPNAGPISRAAVTAVDGGATQTLFRQAVERIRAEKANGKAQAQAQSTQSAQADAARTQASAPVGSDGGPAAGLPGAGNPAAASPGLTPTPSTAPTQEAQTDGTQADQAQQAAPQQRTPQPPATAVGAEVAAVANEAATSDLNDLPQPTQAQKEAGNYKKAHLKFDGLDLTVENPVGSTRSGVDPNGQPWQVTMTAHYGYHKRTMGADGDQVDVYLANDPRPGSPVFVFDQFNADGTFDEHKAVAGVGTQSEAEAIYDAHFSDGSGPRSRRGVTAMPVAEFKTWAASEEAAKGPLQRQASAPPKQSPRDNPGRRMRLNAWQTNPMRAFLGEHGIHSDLAAEFAPGAAERRKAMVPGFGPIFRRSGKQLDDLATLARDAGFTRDDDVAELYPLIERAIRGERIAPLYAEGVAEREMERAAQARYEDFVEQAQAEQDEDPFAPLLDGGFTEADIEAAGLGSASPDLIAQVQALQAQLEAAGLDPEDMLERFALQFPDLSEEQFNEQLQNAYQQALADAAQSRSIQDAGGSADRQAAAPEQPGQDGAIQTGGDLLTSPTRADIEAQQDRTEAAARQASTDRQRAEQDEAAARERAEVARRSQAAADTFELGQDPMANLTGQQDIFGASQPKQETAAQPKQAVARASQPKTETPRLTDAGEELIRNRRGKLKGLAWDDVSSMNDTLKVAQVVKANVWPRPDYAKMVEAGAPAWKAAALKAVYDKLAAAPVTRTTPTDADLRSYIETLAQIRELLAAELDRVAAMPDGSELWKTLKSENVFDKAFPVPADARPMFGRPSPFDRVSEQGKANNKRALLIGGNSAIQALQFDYKMRNKVKDLLAQGFPAKQEAWQKSWEVRATETRNDDVPEAERTGEPQQRFYVYEKGSRWRLAKNHQDGGYATQEQAEAFARSLTARTRETLPPSRGLDLADARRTGPDWREGKDVTAQDIMDHFGFRGVNLGEYVKAKQGVAQLHLNHVYDAFNDLADLMGVPPKAMSLDGTLGVAIGAQGSGKALAHFVPGVNEINITRDAGAGALAHEFGHALDHYFATQHGRATSMAKRPYLSAVVQTLSDPGGVRSEVMEAMRTVMRTINTRSMTEVEARQYLEDQRTRNRKYLDRWVREFSGNKGADQVALKAVAEKLARGELGEPVDGNLEVNLIEFMRAANLKPGNAIASNAITVAYRLRDLADEDRFLKTHIPQTDTNYAKASDAMDAKKAGGEGYWSTPWEKFARAFETFAMDALKSRDRESLYLSGLVDGDGWRDWSESTGKAMPFPEGAERLALQQAFQKLVDTIQTRETEQGIAMFSRPMDMETLQRMFKPLAPLSVTETQLAVADMVKGWKNGPRLRVVATPSELPSPAPADTRGQYLNGTAYLVASNHRSAGNVQRTLAHEAIAHYGLNAMLGDLEWRRAMANIQQGLERGDAALLEMREQVRFAYRDAAGNFMLSPQQEADEIAARAVEVGFDAKTGEFRTGFEWVKRAYSRIAQFLRNLGFDVRFTNAELQGMLARAQRFLASSPKQGEGMVVGGELEPAGALARSESTKTAFESRIDALFAGEKATSGTRVLDRSDVMGLLGYPDVPLMLNERHMLDGLTNHPEMTAKVWKKVPGWIENPAMVYRDPRDTGRIIVIPPESVAGYPMLLVVEPNPTPALRGASQPFQLLVTAYAKTSGKIPAPGYLSASGHLLYLDMKNAPEILQRAGVQFPGQAALQRGRTRILTEKNLAGWRKSAGGLADGAVNSGETKPSGATGAGFDATGATQAAPTLARRGLGADGPKNDTPVAGEDAILPTTTENVSNATTATVGSASDPADTTTGSRPADALRARIADEGRRASQGGNPPPAGSDGVALARGANQWDTPASSRFDNVVYKLQDKLVDTKRVQEAITATAGQIGDDLNVYLQEELFHGRAASRVKDFAAQELKPLLTQMRTLGLQMADVEEFLHARHAREANALIAGREPNMPDGGSGMTNQAADDYFRKLDPAQRRRLEQVAGKVDSIIASTRQLYADYGLEDQSTVDGWGQMFKSYVPLMREDKDGSMGVGQGFSIKGKEVKGRTGSTRKVVDILANVAAQRERVIVRGEKNRVARALVGLAQVNPNPQFWEVRSQPPTERVYDAARDMVVERPDSMFKQRPNVITAKVRDSRGNVTEQAVVLNEDNPRAVRMAQALKNLDAGNLEGLLGASATITRYFAAINTQYNPVFGVVNLVRDVQAAMVNLAATPLAGQQRRIATDTAAALAAIYRDVRAARRGGRATSAWSTLWEQMQADGGTTGYRDLFRTSADRAEQMQSILTPEGWMKTGWGRLITADGRLKVPAAIVQKQAGMLFDWLSDYNEAMENGVRLATYKAALDNGMSREQAASLSKNLTVNFNRRGQVGLQAGALYAFFNAAMQGTARIGQTIFDMDNGNPKTLRLSSVGKKVVYGGALLGSIQALMLAAAGFDDDDPPEFVRERALIIPTGGKTYISIPMPLGLHVIPGLGRHATEFALSGFDKPAHRVLALVAMFADAFNPIGNAGLSIQTLAPTALDPLVALSENRDWTGKPIARVSSNKALPGHAQWKDTATTWSKLIAEGINYVSGGNEYVAGVLSPTPDQIDYLIAQLTGGVGRELSKVEQSARSLITGEELPTYKVPLIGRLVGNADSQASQGNAFYANLNRLNELETEVKGLRKDGRSVEAARLMRERPEARLIPMANRTERRVQELRREKRALVEKGAEKDVVRAKDAQVTAEMTRLNLAVERARETAR